MHVTVVATGFENAPNGASPHRRQARACPCSRTIPTPVFSSDAAAPGASAAPAPAPLDDEDDDKDYFDQIMGLLNKRGK